MGRSQRIRQTILLAAASAAVAIVSSDAQAYCRMTTARSAPASNTPCITEGIPLEWERRCISYGIDERGSAFMTVDEITQVVDTAFATWQEVDCPGGPQALEVRRLVEYTSCREAQYNQNAPNVNTIAFIDDWLERDYDDKAYALTTVWHSVRTGEILDADIQVNEDLGPYGVCPGPNGCTMSHLVNGKVPVDLPNVLTHEVGHFFGLGHTQDSGTATMIAMSPRGEIEKRDLEEDDINGYCAVYPPGSVGGACNYEPRGGLALTCTPTSNNGSGDGGGCCTVTPGRPTGGSRSPWPIAISAALALIWAFQRRR